MDLLHLLTNVHFTGCVFQSIGLLHTPARMKNNYNPGFFQKWTSCFSDLLPLPPIPLRQVAPIFPLKTSYYHQGHFHRKTPSQLESSSKPPRSGIYIGCKAVCYSLAEKKRRMAKAPFSSWRHWSTLGLESGLFSGRLLVAPLFLRLSLEFIKPSSQFHNPNKGVECLQAVFIRKPHLHLSSQSLTILTSPSLTLISAAEKKYVAVKHPYHATLTVISGNDMLLLKSFREMIKCTDICWKGRERDSNELPPLCVWIFALHKLPEVWRQHLKRECLGQYVPLHVHMNLKAHGEVCVLCICRSSAWGWYRIWHLKIVSFPNLNAKIFSCLYVCKVY